MIKQLQDKDFNKVKTHRNERSIRVVLAILLSLNVATAVFVIASVVSRSKSKPTPLFPDFKTKIDEQYKKFKPARGKEEETRVKEEETHNTTPQPTEEFLNLLKPVVHLQGIDDSKGSNITNWVDLTGSPRILLFNGPTYETGVITIPTDGRYHVYSHVKFYVTDNKASNPLETFKHEVVKSNDESEETVLANQVTECREVVHEDSHVDYPSDVRGVLELRQGDKVKVKLSHPKLLTDSIDWNYFGLYLI